MFTLKQYYIFIKKSYIRMYTKIVNKIVFKVLTSLSFI
jgi:hypothetical protein